MSNMAILGTGLMIALLSVGTAQAQQGFDQTGLVDLRNEATLTASCFHVAARLNGAASTLAVKIMNEAPRGSSAADQDAYWKATKLYEQLLQYGKAGDYYSKEWGNNWSRHVPPSQYNDWNEAYGTAMNRINSAAGDSNRIMDAFEFCRVNVPR
jgi:hypothetical protein